MANALYGYLQQKDLLAVQVTNSNVPIFNEAIDQFIASSNEELNAMIALFADKTTNYKENYRAMAISRSQPVDENGKALPIKGGGSADVAFPIHGSGQAWGANYVTRAKLTGADVALTAASIVDGDNRWVRDHIFAALMYGTSAGSGWAFSDPNWGSLSIKGLANGDSQTYNKSGGSNAADTHILFQNAVISDSDNPFPAAVADLTEHPENGGENIVFIPTNLKASVSGLTEFVDLVDGNITSGIGSDSIKSNLGVAHPGKVIGYLKYSHAWVVEWQNHPASYFTVISTEGARPLAMREDPEASLQGFVRVTDGTDPSNYPFYESQYLRRTGFGARNRVGAVVYKIGDSSYAVPANYGSPMA